LSNLADTVGKALDADLINILKRVQAGKPLTSEQRNRLEESRLKDEPVKNKKKHPKHVKTLTELAEIVGIDRTTLTKKFRKIEGAPSKKKWGWPVQAWLDFVQAVKNKSAEDSPDLERDKAKRIKWDAKYAMTRTMKLRGKLITRRSHVERMHEFLSVQMQGHEEWLAGAADLGADLYLLAEAYDKKWRAWYADKLDALGDELDLDEDEE